MAFQVSPGVNSSEINQTTTVPSIIMTAGAFVGQFNWGPVNRRVQTASEVALVSNFGKPDNNTASSFFTAASFLAYGNNLYIVRAANNATYNAQANTTGANIQIQNKEIFETSYLYNNNNNQYGAFVARYPGVMGNSLTISVVDSASYSNTWNVNGGGLSGTFPVAPATSAQATSAGGANDQIHIVVVDSGGLFTGAKNTVLEAFPFLSKALDGVDSLGNPSYYKTALFNNSKYVFAIDPVSYSTTNGTWGTKMANTSFATISTPQTLPLANGTTATVTDGDLITAWGQFTSADAVNVSLVPTGGVSTTVQQYVIDNISSARTDCVAFVSPPSSAVVNQAGAEVVNIQSWWASLARSTTYGFADTGWKYMFDKYNGIYRYVPLNGDTAGLCAYTDQIRDPWYSPAGFNRGNIKNVVRLAWSPSKPQRDTLYPLGINPVVTMQGVGTVLYGDKTMTSQPSAFDRIGVRRLFINLETTISLAAKYSLFEFNDLFTQAQFVALVTPYLRDVKGRRGIYDFMVVCDSTNNTQAVIDSNSFVGDIYVKPARSINYIQLNFIATPTGVSFSTIVGTGQ